MRCGKTHNNSVFVLLLYFIFRHTYTYVSNFWMGRSPHQIIFLEFGSQIKADLMYNILDVDFCNHMHTEIIPSFIFNYSFKIVFCYNFSWKNGIIEFSVQSFCKSGQPILKVVAWVNSCWKMLIVNFCWVKGMSNFKRDKSNFQLVAQDI